MESQDKISFLGKVNLSYNKVNEIILNILSLKYLEQMIQIIKV